MPEKEKPKKEKKQPPRFNVQLAYVTEIVLPRLNKLLIFYENLKRVQSLANARDIVLSLDAFMTSLTYYAQDKKEEYRSRIDEIERVMNEYYLGRKEDGWIEFVNELILFTREITDAAYDLGIIAVQSAKETSLDLEERRHSKIKKEEDE